MRNPDMDYSKNSRPVDLNAKLIKLLKKLEETTDSKLKQQLAEEIETLREQVLTDLGHVL